MEPTQKHIWEHLLNPKVAIVVVGCIAVVVAAVSFTAGKSEANSISPSSGLEGTTVSVALPKNASAPAHATLVFTDGGEHGYVAMQQGGGMYVTYDPAKGLTYKAEASGNNGSYSASVPQGICGLVIKSDQEPMPAPKVVSVALVGDDGNVIPGTEGSFSVTCDVFTLSIKTVASQDPVLPDGKDSSVVTATLTVRGPAQFINGQRIAPGQQKPVIETPLGRLPVEFTTDLGALAPNPSKVTTDLSGQASVTITSADAGIASVRAIALSVGDAKQQVHFPPVITAVKMDFVPPTSPTNYQLKTIPQNPKDLTIDWKFIPAAGLTCGHMTGALSGKGLAANGFYHGPQDGYPEGCPEAWEHASTIQVTATDKDGQTATKTFGARSSEGQGFVNLK